MLLLLFSVEHLRDFTIKVMEDPDGNSTLCNQQVKEINISATFYCNPVSPGRYVKIEKRGPVARGDILALCEVEVYGNNSGKVIMVLCACVCVCVCVCVRVCVYWSSSINKTKQKHFVWLIWVHKANRSI